MKNGKVKVAVVGLRFGGEFPCIYQAHPDVEETIICEQDAELLKNYGDMFGYERRYQNYDELLKSDVDAIHITTGIPNHAELTLKALKAGKHCACTVPMAVTLEDMKQIVRAQKETGLKYMMMETTVYGYQTLQVKQMIANGEIGNIQFMRGIHFQDMECWPEYWLGLPPMHYATHAVSPLLYLSGAIPSAVTCYGSGHMRSELTQKYGNPYPVETATVQFHDKPYVADITRSLFETAHEYIEGFTILGDKGSFEWNSECQPPRVSKFLDKMDQINMGMRGRSIETKDMELVKDNSSLPESIRKFSEQVTILDPQNPHKSILQGGSHHGSHPYMCHEFVRSIIEDRKPEIDAVTAAYWTSVGVCAHLSAMQGGKKVEVPDYAAL